MPENNANHVGFRPRYTLGAHIVAGVRAFPENGPEAALTVFEEVYALVETIQVGIEASCSDEVLINATRGLNRLVALGHLYLCDRQGAHITP